MFADLTNTLGPWSWVIGGILLILLELAVPGVFLVWLGLAAVITGGLDLGLDLSWQFSALIFCVLSAILVLFGRMLSQKSEPKENDIGLLNHRARQLIGNVYVLEEPIVNGEGRIKVGDSVWRVTGVDMPEGISVRVVQTAGTKLVVERSQ